MSQRIKQLTTLISGIFDHKYLLLFFLWVVLTIINVDKAFHIDDTFHLEASAWIQDNPTRPMSGFINWKNDPTPIYSHNQPPLFFYLIALFAGIFGISEVPLHLLISIFTFLALLYFHKLITLLSLKNKNTLLLLFAFCPALIVNQNLMTDVPLLAIILASSYYLLKAGNLDKLKNYCLAALLLGTGLLIKYSILPLFVVLIIVITARRDFKHLFVMAIPLVMLVLWSVWNYAEYGSVHFLDRPGGEIHINRFWAFMACTGSMSAFSFSLLSGSFPALFSRKIIILPLVLFVVQLLLFATGLIPEQLNSNLLNIVFVLNGFLVFFTLGRLFILQMKKEGFRQYIASGAFVMFLYLGSTAAFMVLFAPFIATRHILLILPFMLISGHGLIENAGAVINRISIGMTVILGLLLGISDFTYADYYRRMAAGIVQPEGRTTWTAGHWGWQWYSEKNGMKQYNTNQSDVKKGDWFVFPGNIPIQEQGENLELLLIDKKWEEASLLTFFSGNNFASLYSSSVKNAPWTFSKNPIDTIFIFQVVAIDADSSYQRKTKP